MLEETKRKRGTNNRTDFSHIYLKFRQHSRKHLNLSNNRCLYFMKGSVLQCENPRDFQKCFRNLLGFLFFAHEMRPLHHSPMQQPF